MTIPYVFDTMPAEDVTLHAKWQINQYTITFDSKQGTPVSSITQDYDTDLSEPGDSDRTGYIFMGWYVSDTFDHADHLQVGHTDMAYQAGIADLVGFRIVRMP